MELKKEQNLSHLRNLMILAYADGHLAQVEEHLLLEIAHRLGLDENVIESIKHNEGTIKFILPTTYDDRVDQFRDFLQLVAIDGVIDPEEEKYCRKMAHKYELTESVIDEMMGQYRWS